MQKIKFFSYNLPAGTLSPVLKTVLKNAELSKLLRKTCAHIVNIREIVDVTHLKLQSM
jgi:hypothetical protein